MRDTRWTEQGEQDLQATVNAFLDDAADVLGETFTGGDTADPDVLADDLDQVVTAIEAAALHPDTDEETITELVEATDGLVEGVEDAQEWDDLSVRQKLQFEGYYDVINQKHKDFPGTERPQGVEEARQRRDDPARPRPPGRHRLHGGVLHGRAPPHRQRGRPRKGR